MSFIQDPSWSGCAEQASMARLKAAQPRGSKYLLLHTVSDNWPAASHQPGERRALTPATELAPGMPGAPHALLVVRERDEI